MRSLQNRHHPASVRHSRTRLFVLAAATLGLIVFAWVSIPGTALGAGSRTLTDEYGITRPELVRWLQSHEGDSYYLGTPYKPYDWRSPNGDVNAWGTDSDGSSAGMNCTGFVWHALCAAHGWQSGIAERLPAMTGWADAIRNGDLLNYWFDSKESLLASGVLEKGDIIWMWENGDSSMASDTHHIGIFWGNSPSEDHMWHSDGDANDNWRGMNRVSDIHGKADRVSYQVLKLGGTLTGAFSLQKASALPDISQGNPLYSLEGAEYGLFDSQDKASSHRADRALKTYTTDARGFFKSASDIVAGTYFVAETRAPKGFSPDAGVYRISIEFDKTTKVNAPIGYVTDTPVSNPVSLWLLKRDAQTPDGGAQGSATLAGAHFEIRYYAGYHDAGSLPQSATRTWVVATGQDGRATVSDELKVSGDAFYRTSNGQVTIPLGTVSIQEVKAPDGYLLPDTPDVRVISIKGDGSQPAISVYNAPEFADFVKRGGVEVGKRDRQNGAYLPQGSATLEGATFTVTTLNDQPVIVDDSLFERGAVVKTIESFEQDDGSFIARTDPHSLPVGTYELKETSSSEGYLFDDESRSWSQRFEIAEDGQVASFVDAAGAAQNRVLRGDFSFSKIDGGTGARLARIPFAVTSATTGECHVIVTDENGMASTSASWSPHTFRTNCNDFAAEVPDAPLLEHPAGQDEPPGGEAHASGASQDAAGAAHEARGNAADTPSASAADDARSGRDAPAGVTPSDDRGNVGDDPDDEDQEPPQEGAGDRYRGVDASLLDPSAGIWFNGRTDAEVAADDDMGALPFDTYHVRELKCTSNEGYQLAEFTVRISREAVSLDMGTVDDNAGPIIGTTLADDNGMKLVAANGMQTVTDTVRYANLIPSKTYCVRGQMHRVNEDETDGGVIASGETTFTAQMADGSVEVDFTVDATELAGERLVAFEELHDAQGTVLAIHSDLLYEGQTVRVPSIGTTLVEASSNSHEADASEVTKLVDTVTYKGLAPGDAYTLVGTLHIRNDDGSDGGIATDAQGRAIEARQDFTPETPDGETAVQFSFKAPGLAGKTVVAFEELIRRNVAYATHADIGDAAQSVAFAAPKSVEPDKDETLKKTPSKMANTGDGTFMAAIVLLVAAGFSLVLGIGGNRRLRCGGETVSSPRLWRRSQPNRPGEGGS